MSLNSLIIITSVTMICGEAKIWTDFQKTLHSVSVRSRQRAAPWVPLRCCVPPAGHVAASAGIPHHSAAAPRASQSQSASPDPAASPPPRVGAAAAGGGVTARGGTGTPRAGGRRGCASPGAARRVALPAPRKQALRFLPREHRWALRVLYVVQSRLSHTNCAKLKPRKRCVFLVLVSALWNEPV